MRARCPIPDASTPDARRIGASTHRRIDASTHRRIGAERGARSMAVTAATNVSKAVTRTDPGADDRTRTEPGRRRKLTNGFRPWPAWRTALPGAVAPRAGLPADRLPAAHAASTACNP
ncbi:hypothetical protein D7209_06275 [Burkholderia cepacia]|nr:hypothetical protein [Burkholderia cepacia]MBB0076172.1 hypothetical protein [Burkholderia cepacia]MBB0119351.1 hypothetical protein [Burkholderia cepacia]